jgi:hypothetical protein
MRPGIIKKLRHKRVTFERLLHDAPLNTPAAAVNQPDLAKTGGMRFTDVLFDDRRNIRWCECVQVE